MCVWVCVGVCGCVFVRERECALHFVDVKGHQNDEPGISGMKGWKRKKTKTRVKKSIIAVKMKMETPPLLISIEN